MYLKNNLFRAKVKKSLADAQDVKTKHRIIKENY